MASDPAGDAVSLFAKKRKPASAPASKLSLLNETGHDAEAEPPVEAKKTKGPVQMTDAPSTLDYAYTNTEDTGADDNDSSARSNAKLEALEHSRRLAEAGTLDTIYRGASNRQQFLLQKDTTKANAGSEKSRIAGPKQAPSNLRTTCRFDYRPDRCKDYAETGFCGFGDSCIFLHDRSEYKSSWQLDQEWDAAQKAEQLKAENTEHMVKLAEEKEATATECPLCRGPLMAPVRTLCKHVFCEGCVLKKKKCPVCSAFLNGSFVPYKIK